MQDSASFAAGNYELESYPVEPAMASFDYSIVPGNLGQAWLGTAPNQFFTVTGASIGLKNDLDARMNEFGSSVPQAIAPGQRKVAATFSLYSQDDSATQALYEAARQQSPISVMFQLGDAQGQMMGVYMRSVVPVVPEFDDSRTGCSGGSSPRGHRERWTTKSRWRLRNHDIREREGRWNRRPAAGVRFRVARMSFGRRMELMREVRELARRKEFLESGPSAEERMDAALLQGEIDRLFVMWGLRAVEGLRLDGEAATPELLADRGPEGLFREALEAVRAEVGLTPDERKN